MNTSRQEDESKLVEKLAARYRQQGYEVKAHPVAMDIPFDLGAYRPDLLLREPSGMNYIVEVKGNRALSVDRLREIAQTVSQYPGWRFLLVAEDDASAADFNLRSENLLNVEQMRKRLTDARRLFGEGQHEAAFLLLWPAFEAALRHRAITADLPIERLGVSSLVNHLYSEGELSIAQFKRATHLMEIRNRVAHGFQAGELEQAAYLLNELTGELLQSDPFIDSL